MLEKLRAKPDHVKKSVSLVLTIIIFSIILFVWFSSSDARSREGEIRAKTTSPLESFQMMIGGVVDEAQRGISSAPAYVENASSSSVHVATSSPAFDASGIVIIDASSSTMSRATTSKK